MASIGLSVPPGFTVSTEACQQYQAAGQALPPGLWDEIVGALRWVEAHMAARLGDPRSPLLLSVRSGAAVRPPRSIVAGLNRSSAVPPAPHALLIHYFRCPCPG